MPHAPIPAARDLSRWLLAILVLCAATLAPPALARDLVVTIDLPASVGPGGATELSARVDGGRELVWTVDWGDGTPSPPIRPQPPRVLTARHSFEAPGTYTVVVRATDTASSDSGLARQTVVVAGPAPPPVKTPPAPLADPGRRPTRPGDAPPATAPPTTPPGGGSGTPWFVWLAGGLAVVLAIGLGTAFGLAGRSPEPPAPPSIELRPVADRTGRQRIDPDPAIRGSLSLRLRPDPGTARVRPNEEPS